MLDISWVALLTQALSFIVLILVLKLFFPLISGIIESRQKEIQDNIDRITEDRRASAQDRLDCERRLAGVDAEARERIAAAVKQAAQEAAAIVEKAREEASEQRARAVAEIDQERKKAIMAIRAEMADLAVTAAGKILQREITPAVHRELIENFISQAGTPS